MISAGLHLVHKPVGPTSFATVRERAPASGRWKICHAGTLDPFAEGLLILLAGPATRLMDLLHALPKTYEAEVRWGSETDNGDPTGHAIARGDASALTPEALDVALTPFLGWREQVPPATSAKKIDGEPAYKKAHRGEPVTLPPSKVFLHTARWLSHDLPRSSRLLLTTRGGYYVRALARDLGRALGARAHLRTLRRTQIGPFSDPGPNEEVALKGIEAVPWMQRRHVTPDERKALKARKTIAIGPLAPPAWEAPPGFPDPAAPIAAVSVEGHVFALLRAKEGTLATETWLSPGF